MDMGRRADILFNPAAATLRDAFQKCTFEIVRDGRWYFHLPICLFSFDCQLSLSRFFSLLSKGLLLEAFGHWAPETYSAQRHGTVAA